MASKEFGLMKLLEKLIGERGKGAMSDKEMKTLKDAGSEMFIDQDEGWLAKPQHQRGRGIGASDKILNPYIDRSGYGGTGLGSIYTDPNTGVVSRNRGAVSNAEMEALRRSELASRGFNFETDRGAVSDNELQNFRIASQYVDDGALTGWLTHMMPALQQMGVGNLDMNLPPNELRNIIEAITAPKTGAMSDRERAMLQGMTQGMATGGTLGNLGL